MNLGLLIYKKAVSAFSTPWGTGDSQREVVVLDPAQQGDPGGQ